MAIAPIMGGERVRRIPKPLHGGIEAVWERSFKSKSRYQLHKYSTDSLDVITEMPDHSLIEIDRNPEYELSERLYKSMPNEWSEMENICRISYAVSRHWIPYSFAEIESLLGPKKCRDSAANLKYKDIIAISGEDEFKDVTNRIFHDAVESVARLWYRAWNVFTK
jgi:hypothetical protein